ncbi:MAG: xanthine dehydrogenase family protein molybdopterin-binding subunit [Ectothiorhodospiraceae bacterium AqS1]|nr:xanthine dehydrogenase family protein molybdopterin-binding subunit [Ectothiorhodospiraceae bacterium AqS1]
MQFISSGLAPAAGSIASIVPEGIVRGEKSGPISRRSFIKRSGIIGLAIGFAPAGFAQSTADAQEAASLAPDRQPSAFVHIAPDGKVTLQINRVEFGQGAHSGLARVLAEELDADWETVHAELAPAAGAYKDPVAGLQFTGGSSAIANSFTQYRELGARARAMLIQAAADEWGVGIDAITTSNGRLYGPEGKSAGYGEFSEAAAALEVPEEVSLKDPSDFRLIGQSFNRLDTVDKSTGKQRFGIDITLSSMKTVLIARPPWFSGKAIAIDDRAALAIDGVQGVMPIDLPRGASGAAVVADGFWPASRARQALEIEWQPPEGELPDSARIDAEFKALLGRKGLPARTAEMGDQKKTSQTITADFRFPFLAHAPMEPLNAVIEVSGSGDDTRYDIHTGSQFQTTDQATVAAVLGVKPEMVHIHTLFAGGSFGRRANLDADYLVEAAQAMKAWMAAGRREPLKVMWSREDDIRGGYYRPVNMHRAEIALDEKGDILAWDHTIVGHSLLIGTPFESFFVKDGVDSSVIGGVADTAYDVPLALSVHHPSTSVPVLWWRSVEHTHTAFVMETLIDEIARAGDRDPVALRRSLLAKHPRHLAALDLVVEKSGYGTKTLAEGHAIGIAMHESFGSVVAHAVELSIEGNRPKLHHITSAVHCNLAINPRSIVAQVEGSVLMAIGTTLEGAEITLSEGRVEQSNFNDYIVARMPDMPPIDVHIVPSGDAPTGVGEPGLPPAAPAIANAIFALTGAPVRELPIRLG